VHAKEGQADCEGRETRKRRKKKKCTRQNHPEEKTPTPGEVPQGAPRQDTGRTLADERQTNVPDRPTPQHFSQHDNKPGVGGRLVATVHANSKRTRQAISPCFPSTCSASEAGPLSLSMGSVFGAQKGISESGGGLRGGKRKKGPAFSLEKNKTKITEATLLNMAPS